MKVRVEKGRFFWVRERVLNNAAIRSDFGAYAFASIDVSITDSLNLHIPPDQAWR